MRLFCKVFAVLHPDQALAAVLSSVAKELPIEQVALSDARGRFLAGSVLNPLDQPPFDKSAMDGFAYGSSSGSAALPGTSLRSVGILAAGASVVPAPGPGECVRIMTGAPLPPGADRVQRVEFVRESGDSVVFTEAERGDNVIRRGSHSRSGDTLLEPRVLAASDIGVLAAAGLKSASVRRRPRAAVLSTGTELVEPGESLPPGRIYDSNRYQLAAHAESNGCEVLDLGIAPDDPDAISAALERGLSEADFLLVSGGVSMGNFDFLPSSCAAVGVSAVFHKVAVKPGKPFFFGLREDRAVFALPGNPLAAYIDFELFVVPYIHALAGVSFSPPVAACRAGAELSAGDPERVEYLPVRVAGGLCYPLRSVGSSAVPVLALADGFAVLPIGSGVVQEGASVDVRFVR